MILATTWPGAFCWAAFCFAIAWIIVTQIKSQHVEFEMTYKDGQWKAGPSEKKEDQP